MSAESSEARTLPLRGFARLTVEERTGLSRKGGEAAHAKGTAHEFTSEEAKRAGRRGGLEVAKRRREAKEAEPSVEPATDKATGT
jgi:hypothetical protein